MMHKPNCMSVVIMSHHLLCWLCLLLCTCTCDSCLSLPSSLPSMITAASLLPGRVEQAGRSEWRHSWW